jgi:hypothetical protein
MILIKTNKSSSTRACGASGSISPDFGEAFTPELREQEDWLRQQISSQR